jgi:hypothetical protein
VEVHDRRACQRGERAHIDPALAWEQIGGLGVRCRENHRVGGNPERIQSDPGDAPGLELDLADPRPRHHLDAELGERARRRLRVDALERHPGPADVGGIRLPEQTRLEDHRGQRERSIARAGVERRPRHEIPEAIDRARRLPGPCQPRAEAALVERRILEVELREPQRGRRDPQALGPRHVREAREARRPMQRRRKPVTAQPRNPPAGRDDRNREPALDLDPIARADPLEEAAIRRAAAQEDVLPVVDREALVLRRPGGASQPRARLE